MWSIIHQLPHFHCNWYMMTYHTAHLTQLLCTHTVQNFKKRVGFVLSGPERMRVPGCHVGDSGKGLSWAGILSDTLPPTPMHSSGTEETEPHEDLYFSCRSFGKAFGQLFECWGFNVVFKNDGNLWKHRTEPSGVSKACRFYWDNLKALENTAPPPTLNAGHHGHVIATWSYTLSLRIIPALTVSGQCYFLCLLNVTTDHQQLGLTGME